MPELVDVLDAAKALGVAPSRVRALIADGALDADKLGGRWVVHWESVVARRRGSAAPGRPMTSRNAWALLLIASGETPPSDLDPHARWRIGQTLKHHGLSDLGGRLDRRAAARSMWALPGELRAMRDDGALVLTGSSAVGVLRLDLAAPDTLDAYVPEGRRDAVVEEYGLEPAPVSRANVILRAVPDEAWSLASRRVAPSAAVGVDLAGYVDSRSTRVGRDLLARLDAERVP